MSEVNPYVFPLKTELFERIRTSNKAAINQLFLVGLGIVTAPNNETRIQGEQELPTKLLAIGANTNTGTLLIFVKYLKGLEVEKNATLKQKQLIIADIFKANYMR